MKDLPAARWLLRRLANPGWAPLGVVILYLVLVERGLSHRYDPFLHFLGGASMAYFLSGVLDLLPRLLPPGSRGLRWWLAFTSTTTVALFWEFAEFASDRWRGTSSQISLSETMLDLFLGVAGAISTLLLLAIVSRPAATSAGTAAEPPR